MAAQMSSAEVELTAIIRAGMRSSVLQLGMIIDDRVYF